MTIFYIPNPTQYLNLTLLTTDTKQEFIETKVIVNSLLIVSIRP